MWSSIVQLIYFITFMNFYSNFVTAYNNKSKNIFKIRVWQLLYVHVFLNTLMKRYCSNQTKINIVTARNIVSNGVVIKSRPSSYYIILSGYRDALLKLLHQIKWWLRLTSRVQSFKGNNNKLTIKSLKLINFQIWIKV